MSANVFLAARIAGCAPASSSPPPDAPTACPSAIARRLHSLAGSTCLFRPSIGLAKASLTSNKSDISISSPARSNARRAAKVPQLNHRSPAVTVRFTIRALWSGDFFSAASDTNQQPPRVTTLRCIPRIDHPVRSTGFTPESTQRGLIAIPSARVCIPPSWPANDLRSKAAIFRTPCTRWLPAHRRSSSARCKATYWHHLAR